MDDGATPTTKEGLPISSSIQTTQVDWVQALLSSVLTAGLTDATPNEIVAPVLGGSEVTRPAPPMTPQFEAPSAEDLRVGIAATGPPGTRRDRHRRAVRLRRTGRGGDPTRGSTTARRSPRSTT